MHLTERVSLRLPTGYQLRLVLYAWCKTLVCAGMRVRLLATLALASSGHVRTLKSIIQGLKVPPLVLIFEHTNRLPDVVHRLAIGEHQKRDTTDFLWVAC